MFQSPQTQFNSNAALPVVALSQILSAFSYALDLTDGQPAGHSIRCSFIATRLGQHLGLAKSELRDIYYATMLKDLGCSSNAARIANIYMVDDRKFKHDFKFIDNSISAKLKFVFTQTAATQGWLTRVRALGHAIKNSDDIANEMIYTRCTRGADIARTLRFSENVADAIAHLDEHWDGSGEPWSKTKDDIPLGARIALLAQIADVFFMVGGPDAARQEIEERSGTWLDPFLSHAFLAMTEDPEFWTMLGADDIERRLVAMEPDEAPVMVDEDYLDDIATAFGQVIDSKSPFTGGHSLRVGHLCDQLAEHMGFDPLHRRRLKRAAMLHDVGKLGISSQILEKPGKLDDAEWVQMRRHAEYTAEILGRIPCLNDIAAIAAAHHERLDGCGYPLKLSAADICVDTRIITLCDIYDALTADRPYRDAMPTEKALAILESEAGKAVDPDCLAAFKELVAKPSFFDISFPMTNAAH